MKTLLGPTEIIFLKLIEGVEKPGDHRRIDTTTSFMPVVIECIENVVDGGRVFSVAHYGMQLGDAMADPEVCLLLTESGKITPMSFRNDYLGVCQSAVKINGGEIHCNEKLQEEIYDFCIDWFRNIAEQQDLD